MSEENSLYNKTGGKPLHLTFVGKPGVGKLAIIHALKRSTAKGNNATQVLKLDLVQSKNNIDVIIEPNSSVVWVVDLFYLTKSNEQILVDFKPLESRRVLAVIVTKVGYVAAKEHPQQLQREQRDSIRALVRTRCEELIRILRVPFISYSETEATPACDEQLLQALFTLL